jgi:hypothetical protein
MAQRRSTRSAMDEEPATRRRPARRRDRQPADRDEPEAVDTEDIADDYDLEPADSDEAEPADSEEPEAVEDLEPDEADDEPADDDGRERPSRRAERRVNGSGLTARKAARAALSQIMELTDKSAEGITEVRRTDDGWVVGIEIVEDRRIPSAADILATYEVTLDAGGELMSYRRARRYMRGRGDSGDGS